MEKEKISDKDLEEMCIYKRIIEETLYPTDTSCEDCDGYDLRCELYSPINKEVEKKFDEKGYYK